MRSGTWGTSGEGLWGERREFYRVPAATIRGGEGDEVVRRHAVQGVAAYLILCNYSPSAIVASYFCICPQGSKQASACRTPMIVVPSLVRPCPTFLALPEASAERRVSPGRGQDPRCGPPRHDVGPVHVGARRKRVARNRRVRHVARKRRRRHRHRCSSSRSGSSSLGAADGRRRRFDRRVIASGFHSYRRRNCRGCS